MKTNIKLNLYKGINIFLFSFLLLAIFYLILLDKAGLPIVLDLQLHTLFINNFFENDRIMRLLLISIFALPITTLSFFLLDKLHIKKILSLSLCLGIICVMGYTYNSATTSMLGEHLPMPTPLLDTKKDSILIAHGAGQIDGKKYTNSLEALELAVKNGYKFIELDLLITKDKRIIAAHDWKMFEEMTGIKSRNLAEILHTHTHTHTTFL